MLLHRVDGSLSSLCLWGIAPELNFTLRPFQKDTLWVIPTNGRRWGGDGKIITSVRGLSVVRLEETGAPGILSNRNANRFGRAAYQQDAVVPNNVISASGFPAPGRAEGTRRGHGSAGPGAEAGGPGGFRGSRRAPQPALPS